LLEQQRQRLLRRVQSQRQLADRAVIDEQLAARLVAEQFPQYKDLSIEAVVPGGWDNKTFRLGDDLKIRLPSGAAYAGQIEKEHRWLPYLAPHLPLPIPQPIALGTPTSSYPYHWSISRWLPGRPIKSGSETIAKELARFLTALQGVDPKGGPPPGPDNFFRGSSLHHYDKQARQAIEKLEGTIDHEKASDLWQRALDSCYDDPPVWLHGDISGGNLLAQDGALSAVIDFGQMAVGDPACDLVAAWTLFDAPSREVFQAGVAADEAMWRRAKGWALWKALVVFSRLTNAPQEQYELSRRLLLLFGLFHEEAELS